MRRFLRACVVFLVLLASCVTRGASKPTLSGLFHPSNSEAPASPYKTVLYRDQPDEPQLTAEKRYFCRKYFVYNPVRGRCLPTEMAFRKGRFSRRFNSRYARF